MTNLRKHARDKPCQVRYPGVCSHDVRETVLAHLRMPGITGYGMKASDIHASWCCARCHDVYDGRVKSDMSKKERDAGFKDGVLRTQNLLIEQGLIKW